MFRRSTAWVLRRPRLTIVVAVLVSIPLAFYAFPPANNSFDIWLDADDPTYRTYMDYRDQFESEEFIVVAFRDDNIFTPENLDSIRRLARAMEQVEGVDSVLSLVDAEDFVAEGDALEVRPLVGDETPQQPGALAEIRRKALTNPLLLDNLVSKDGTATAIYGTVNDRDVALRRKIHEEMKALVEDETQRTGNRYYLSGNPVLDSEFERISQQDNVTFSVVTTIVIIVALYLLYRSVTGIVLPVLVVVLATVWTVGLYGLMGNTLNMMSTMLPAVILAISVADAVHLLCQYNDESLSGARDRGQALIETLAKVGRPCLFTSLTTAIGFASFSVSRIGPVRLQGIYTALGILIAFFLTVTLLPAILSLVPMPRIGHRLREGGDWIARGLDAALRVVFRFPGTILVVSLVILVLSVAGMWQLKRETNAIEFLKKSNELRVALEFIEENLTGVFTLEVVIRGPEGSMNDPATLRKVQDVRKVLNDQPEVTKTLHMNDLVMETNRAMNGGDWRHYKLPESRKTVAEYLLLYEMSGGEELETLVSPDASTARLSVRSIVMPAERAKALVETLEAELEDRFQAPLHAHVTGVIPVWVQVDTYLLSSQIRSFSIAAVGIFIMMCLLMGSVRLGLLSMVPNLLPVIVTMGIMGWAGIRLDTATIMITSVALGIAVDDTIHFLARFKRVMALSGDYEEATRQTLTGVGRAIVFTSFILFCGFISLTLGHFKPTIYFGFLTSITMVAALIGDLFLLPVLLRYCWPFRKGMA